MVKFGKYFDTMVAQKPEWRKAYVDYPKLNQLLSIIKKGVTFITHDEQGNFLIKPAHPENLEDDDRDEKIFALSEGHPLLPQNSNSYGDVATSMEERPPQGLVRETSACLDDAEPVNGSGLATAVSGPFFGSSRRSAASIDSPTQDENPEFPDVSMTNLSDKGSDKGAARSEAIPIDNEVGQECRTPTSGSAPQNFDEISPEHGDDLGPLLRRADGSSKMKSAQVWQKYKALRTGSTLPGIDSKPHLTEQSTDGYVSRTCRRDSVEGASAVSAPATPTSAQHRVSSTRSLTGASSFFGSLRSLPPGDMKSRGESLLEKGAPLAPDMMPDIAPLSPSAKSPSNASRRRLIPHMDDTAVDCAVEFETLLAKEARKATEFALKSLDTFLKYVDENKDSWKSATFTNKMRVKDNMRFAYKEVCHLVSFGETNELAVKTALKKYLHSHPFFVGEDISEEVLLPPMNEAMYKTQSLQLIIEELWAEVFNEGNIDMARKNIYALHATPREAFRAGFFLCLIISVILYWVHILFELEPNDTVMNHLHNVLPVVRFFVTLMFSFITWSWVLYIFQKYQINYLYVFELNQTASTSWLKALEYGLFMMFLALLSGALYVRCQLGKHYYNPNRSEGFPVAAPYIIPVFIFALVLSILVPPRHVFTRTRNAFFKVFRRLMILPWGYVRFIEFFVADWGTSLPIPLGDLLYTLCFFTAAPQYAYMNETGDNVCRDVQAKYQFPIAALPYFWRACQTMKMYLRTKNKAHLINHGKYQSFLILFSLEWWYALDKGRELSIAVWFFHVLAEIYAFVWDVLMDWGWIQLRKRGCMFKNFSTYAYAMVFDFIARMIFVVFSLWVQPHTGLSIILFIEGLLEIFRRSVWSIFRVENENLNNLETYRNIDFVPHVVLPQDSEL